MYANYTIKTFENGKQAKKLTNNGVNNLIKAKYICMNNVTMNYSMSYVIFLKYTIL